MKPCHVSVPTEKVNLRAGLDTDWRASFNAERLPATAYSFARPSVPLVSERCSSDVY